MHILQRMGFLEREDDGKENIWKEIFERNIHIKKSMKR